MSIVGTIYGVVLNDEAELALLARSFAEKPYQRPPRAPVVYLKPRSCVGSVGAPVFMPNGVDRVQAASTLALLFARDAVSVSHDSTWDAVGAVCLALDISLPTSSYYRPAVAERCRDGFLPLGRFAAPAMPDEIALSVDGEEVHRWSTERLHRKVGALVADLSAFMTLKAGDLLLVGLPGDAPQVGVGRSLRVEGGTLPALTVSIVGDQA